MITHLEPDSLEYEVKWALESLTMNKASGGDGIPVELFQIPYDYKVEVRNRFKGLDLIDRVPDELWTEVCDIVQETGIKTIPMGKKSKKAKWLSMEALQIAVKRREVKSKGEKERYKHLNAEFQTIARRDKESLPQGSMEINRGKQQNGKD